MSSNSDISSDGHVDRDQLPLSFGAFKPVGHVAVVLPDNDAGVAFARALREELGLPAAGVLYFHADDVAARFKDLLPEASGASGFGSEIQSMRQIYLLATEGASLVLVHAPEGDQIDRLEALARRHGAKVAKRYGRLLIEDLI